MGLIKAEDTVGSLTSKDKLPRNRYTCRCTEEVFGPSKSSGNPMITRTWEICLPEQVLINGMNKEIGGVTFNQYLTTKKLGADGTEDTEGTKKAVGRVLEDYRRLGFPSTQLDTDNPEMFAKGVVADLILDTDESKQLQSATPEQLAAGQKWGDPIKDANGAEIITYRVKFVETLGRSNVEVNKAF